MYRDQTTTEVRRLSHAELAMRAARRIKKAREKEKAGHAVCHHLLRMLDAPDERRAKGPPDRPREEAKQYSLGL